MEDDDEEGEEEDEEGEEEEGEEEEEQEEEKEVWMAISIRNSFHADREFEEPICFSNSLKQYVKASCIRFSTQGV